MIVSDCVGLCVIVCSYVELCGLVFIVFVWCVARFDCMGSCDRALLCGVLWTSCVLRACA